MATHIDRMTMTTDKTHSDRLLSFTIPDREARGRMVRLEGSLFAILEAHDYPPPLRRLLSEALVLTAMMGGLIKNEDSQLTLQAQSQDGAIRLLVCDWRAGELRGYVQPAEGRGDMLDDTPTMADLFGTGYLAITFDLGGEGGRYQGIVPIVGETLSEACESYFAQSEQVPTLIRTAVAPDGESPRAAGLLVQHLPEGEEGRERLHVRLNHPEWEHVATMAASMTGEELLEPALSLEELVWRLFHEEREVRVVRGGAIARGCRCSVDHFADVLNRFPEAERAHMANDQGLIMVDCAFCSRLFPIEA